MTYVKIHTDPPLFFYPSGPDPYPLLKNIGTLRNAVSVGGSSSPSVSVELDNAAGEITGLFTIPPYRKKGEIYRDSNLIFQGVIGSVTLAETATLTIEA